MEIHYENFKTNEITNYTDLQYHNTMIIYKITVILSEITIRVVL